MRGLNKIESLEDLKVLRLQLKHQLKIQKLEAENSRLKMMQEFESKKLLSNVSKLVISAFQKTALSSFFRLFK